MQIYSEPELVTFGQGQLQLLQKTLKATDANTELVDIIAVDQLKLGKNGKTIHGSAVLSRSMFQQVAHKLGPGTARVVKSLAGIGTADTDASRVFDVAFAVRVWNKLVELRFAELAKYRMIVNRKTHSLEGLVGNSQQYIKNHEVLQTSLTICEDVHGTTCSFYGARLIGRGMTLWFRKPASSVIITLRDKTYSFNEGYYFTVQEASGAALRGSVAVFSSHGVSLAPFKPFGARMSRKHNAVTFGGKVAQLFSTVFDKKFEWTALEHGISTVASRPLGYSVEMSTKAVEVQSRAVVRILRSLGLQQELSQDILKRTLRTDSDGELEAPPLHLGTEYSKKAALDLFLQLLGTARTLRPDLRECAELVAYKLLVGRVLFV